MALSRNRERAMSNQNRKSGLGGLTRHWRRSAFGMGVMAEGGRRAGAFTLIELLVVMTITAILAGMLLPSLARAKGRAHDARCRNNLRQLALGLHLYAESRPQAPTRKSDGPTTNSPRSLPRATMAARTSRFSMATSIPSTRRRRHGTTGSGTALTITWRSRFCRTSRSIGPLTGAATGHEPRSASERGRPRPQRTASVTGNDPSRSEGRAGLHASIGRR